MKCTIVKYHGIMYYLPPWMQQNAYVFWSQYWTVRPHEYWLIINIWTRNIYCFRKTGLFVLLLLHQKIVTSIIKCIVQDISRGMFFTGSNRHMLPMIVAFNAYHAKFLIKSFPSLVMLLQSEEIKMVKANKVKNENCK